LNLRFASEQILGPTIAGIIVDRSGVGTAFGLAAGVVASDSADDSAARAGSAPLVSGSS
jgi:hypothetical protein